MKATKIIREQLGVHILNKLWGKYVNLGIKTRFEKFAEEKCLHKIK
jgi:hypothetical protein